MRTGILLLPLITGTLAIAVPDSPGADEIYRWVDDDGIVHFTDSAEGVPDAEIIDIRSTPPKQSQSLVVAAEGKATSEAPAESYAQQRRDERTEARRQAAEERQQIEANCQDARERIATLEPSPRVQIKGEDGTITRLDDDKRLELLDDAKSYIGRNCNS